MKETKNGTGWIKNSQCNFEFVLAQKKNSQLEDCLKSLVHFHSDRASARSYCH